MRGFHVWGWCVVCHLVHLKFWVCTHKTAAFITINELVFTFVKINFKPTIITNEYHINHSSPSILASFGIRYLIPCCGFTESLALISLIDIAPNLSTSLDAKNTCFALIISSPTIQPGSIQNEVMPVQAGCFLDCLNLDQFFICEFGFHQNTIN